MKRRVVVTTRAEQSQAHANEVLATYRGMIENHKPLPGRLSPWPTLSHEALVLPRIVSIAEDFARSTLVEVSEARVDTSVPLQVLFWEQAEAATEASWDNIISAWGEWHTVELKSFLDYNELRGYIEARNSLLHGLGVMTRKQRRGKSRQRTESRLGHAKIRLDGDRLILEPHHAVRAADIVASFVEWLDLDLQSRGLLPT